MVAFPYRATFGLNRYRKTLVFFVFSGVRTLGANRLMITLTKISQADALFN
jgi:hypothetical protein